MEKLAIKINNLSFKYVGSNENVLKNINLEIPHGAFYVLIGPSGSGKSTLLTLLRGFHQEIGGELKGEIRVFGKNISEVSIAELGKVIGIVFQNPALQLHQLRVIDEVASAPMYQGLPYQECLGRAGRLVDELLGREFYERSPEELSAGQQQRVAIAASLSLEAEILLLDEPFSFLDETADKLLVTLLKELHRKGKTIIIATHDVAQIANLSTSIGVMDKGKLVLNGSPKNIFYSPKLPAIIPPPLFVQAAQKVKLTTKPLSWQTVLPKLIIKKTKIKKVIPSSDKTKLSLQGITFNYLNTNFGVKNINLDIYRSEIFGLIGANGSGKTTLAKIILGLLKPQKGKVTLDQKDITLLPTEERAKNIGYVTQDPLDMFFETNLWDEAAAGPRFLNLPDPKQLAKNTLQQFHLWQYKDRHPDSISGGEKSRLGIVDIAVNNTSVLLLDEPEFGLDPKSWEEIVTYLKQLKRIGKTVIVISQDLEAAFFLCDRIGVMKDGSIMKVGSPIEIFKNKSLVVKSGLSSLSFSPILKELPDNVTFLKKEFIENLSGIKK